jgi:hypothetical protein
VKKGRWNSNGPSQLRGRTSSVRKLLLWGFGSVGRAAALAFAIVLAFATVVAGLTATFALARVLALASVFLLHIVLVLRLVLRCN